MPDEIEFTLNGQPFRLSRAHVTKIMNGVVPEVVRTHGVVVNGIEYPVKQVLERAIGVDRADFISTAARRHLRRLDFEVRSHRQAS